QYGLQADKVSFGNETVKKVQSKEKIELENKMGIFEFKLEQLKEDVKKFIQDDVRTSKDAKDFEEFIYRDLPAIFWKSSVGMKLVEENRKKGTGTLNSVKPGERNEDEFQAMWGRAYDVSEGK
ncbi:MAG: hypothetical protein PHC34_13820, partial [Candidatus Gastranaerophilales bacterium]|nr:hypothetical protein [Candidatus Gastranaerophilales bacterium]